MTKSSIATQPERVRQMFGSIAARYDLANHLLSCGIDFYWRKRAAEVAASWQPKKIVDLATGTGDLALALQKKLPDAGLWVSISCLKCWNWRNEKVCVRQSFRMQ